MPAMLELENPYLSRHHTLRDTRKDVFKNVVLNNCCGYQDLCHYLSFCFLPQTETESHKKKEVFQQEILLLPLQIFNLIYHRFPDLFLLHFKRLSPLSGYSGVDEDGDQEHRGDGEVLERQNNRRVRHRGVGGGADRPEDAASQWAAGGHRGNRQGSEENVKMFLASWPAFCVYRTEPLCNTLRFFFSSSVVLEERTCPPSQSTVTFL